jgi:HAD superfamily hydrolase (TIGR01484 family)
MRYVAVAAGFDGTLAREDRCDERCIDALKALATTGRKLILVTGRGLRDLLEIFPEARLFDFVVAENGAVMHQPATRESRILAQAPPEILLQELRRRHVTPLSVGSSIVTTVQANEREVAEALRKLQLDFQLVTNPGALMMLPAGVNKASGVWAALKELGVSRHNLVAIGDGENDLALFEFAEHAVAVQNADPLVKRMADRTTLGEYCDGFLELVQDLVRSDLADALPRHRIVLGFGPDRQEAQLAPCRDWLLVHGPRGSGKAALVCRLLEQLVSLSYQCCLIGADLGQSAPLTSGLKKFGHAHEAPRLTDILAALEKPNASVAVNLAALPVESRPVFTDALLLQLQALHDRLGRPHAVLMHEAHAFVAGGTLATAPARFSEVTMVFATSEPAQLPSQVLGSIHWIVDAATQTITAGRGASWAAPLPPGSGSDPRSSSGAAMACPY